MPGFDLTEVAAHIEYTWIGGTWDDGVLKQAPTINLPIHSSVLHYGQSAFEGMKAFTMKDGKIRVFRPMENSKRINQSCVAASMPLIPTNMFLLALQRVIHANKQYVPSYESKASLYIRPFVFGSGASIAPIQSPEYKFLILVMPVGHYYNTDKPVRALIKYGFDRAAPFGTGHVKLAGNYCPQMKGTIDAARDGYDILLFLDSQTRSFIDEFATSNFIGLEVCTKTKNIIYTTPKSRTALESITNRSLQDIASRILGWKVVLRPIPWQEVFQGKFKEIAACGTAVVVTPIASITKQALKPSVIDDGFITPTADQINNESVALDGSDKLCQLSQIYRDIQTGDYEAWQDLDWMWPVDGIH